MRLLLILFFFVNIQRISAQCWPEDEIINSIPQVNGNNGFGTQLEKSGEYLVASIPYSDSLEHQTGLVYVYANDPNSLTKVATLFPSDPQEYLEFGFNITASQNRIAVAARYYDAKGFPKHKIYIFTKTSSENWTTKSESYQIIVDHKVERYYRIEIMDIYDSELAVSYGEVEYTYPIYRSKNIRLFSLGNSSYSQEAIIEPFIEKFGSIDLRLSLGKDIIAITDDNFNNGSKLIGKSLLVEKVNNVWDVDNYIDIPVEELTSNDYFHFGKNILIQDDEIFISSYINNESWDIEPVVDVYTKPASGWSDIQFKSRLKTNQTLLHPIYVRNFNLELIDNTLYLGLYSLANKVYSFDKKSGNWSTSPSKTISSPDPYINNFGASLTAFHDNLFIGAPHFGSHPLSRDYNISERLYAYKINTEKEFILQGTIFEEEDNSSKHLFGKAVSISDNTMAVGIIGDRHNGPYTGSVQLFNFDEKSENWVESYQIVNPTSRAYDNFGYAVELDHNNLFISAIFRDSVNIDSTDVNYGVGKVYHYTLQNGSWIKYSEISAPILKKQTNFGQDIAYHNGTLAISAYNSSTSENQGKVYLYEINNGNWIHKGILEPTEPMRGDNFGRSLILNDSILLAGTGSPEYDSRYDMKVYVFNKKQEWVSAYEDAILVPANPSRSDNFGFDVSLYANTIIVGSPGYSSDFPNDRFEGRAYLFERPKNGWYGTINETAEFFPSDGEENAQFGTSVYIDYDNIIIGSPHSARLENNTIATNNSDGKIKPGKVYFYSRPSTGWKSTSEDLKMTSTRPHFLDGFGANIEVGRGQLMVTALFDDNETNFKAGAVHLYNRVPYIEVDFGKICHTDPPIDLTAHPFDGIFSGMAITDNKEGIFDPSKAKIGLNLVTYEVGSCKHSIYINVGKPPEILSSSDQFIKKCKGDTAQLFIETSGSFPTYKWFKEVNSEWVEFEKSKNYKHLMATDPGNYACTIEGRYCNIQTVNFSIENTDHSPFLNMVDTIICDTGVDIEIHDNANISDHNWFQNINEGNFNLVSEASSYFVTESSSITCGFNYDDCYFNSDTINITLKEPPNVLIMDTPIICNDDIVQLVAQPDGGYWNGNGITSDGDFDPSKVINGDHLLTYTYSTNSDCSFEFTHQVEVKRLPYPELDLNPSNLVCSYDSVKIEIEDFENYINPITNWYRMDTEKKIISSNHSSYLTINKKGRYQVEVISEECNIYSDIIDIEGRQSEIFVPNAFSPNNDGVNDSFHIVGDDFDEFNIVIFDRAGRNIFDSDDAEFNWNVSDRVKGVYFYLINYTDCDYKEQSVKGSIQVMR